MLHHPNSSEDQVHMISSVFSLPGRKKVETTSILEKAAWGSRLRADDSNHSFSSLILYPHFLLTQEWGSWEVVSTHPRFGQESLVTSVFLMWLSRSFFHSQKYLSLEIHSMVVLCKRHTKCLGKWEEQVIDKTIGIFSKAEEKKIGHTLFLRAELVGTPRNEDHKTSWNVGFLSFALAGLSLFWLLSESHSCLPRAIRTLNDSLTTGNQIASCLFQHGQEQPSGNLLPGTRTGNVKRRMTCTA